MQSAIWICAIVLLGGQKDGRADSPTAKGAATKSASAAKTPSASEHVGSGQIKVFAKVVAKYDLSVPSQEAGALISLDDEGGELLEGTNLAKGQLIARIDASESMLQKQAAQREFEAAEVQAKSNAPIEAAQATTKVALAEYEASKDINRRKQSAISDFELRRQYLTYVRSDKQELVARMEKEVAEKTMLVKKAQIEAANLDITRRQVGSPIDGVVAELFKKPGEWVNPGDVIARVVHMKTVQVDGFVEAKLYRPSQLSGRSVRVIVPFPDGAEEFTGTIDHVGSLVTGGGLFVVRANIENRQENGHWILRPDLPVELEIQLK